MLLNASCRLLAIFVVKRCVELNLTFFDKTKQGCEINTKEMFSFITLINTTVTIRLHFP